MKIPDAPQKRDLRRTPTNGRGIDNPNNGELHGMHERTESQVVQLQLRTVYP